MIFECDGFRISSSVTEIGTMFYFEDTHRDEFLQILTEEEMRKATLQLNSYFARYLRSLKPLK
jgi:hypothetical protein